MANELKNVFPERSKKLTGRTTFNSSATLAILSRTVCFSKGATHYDLKGELDNNPNVTIEDATKDDYIIICYRKAQNTLCPKDNFKKFDKDEPLYLIGWSRFGIVTKFKWHGDAWKRL